MPEHEVEARLRAGVFSWVDFSRSLTGGGDWKRFCELEDFKELMPELPDTRDLYARAVSSARKAKGGKSSARIRAEAQSMTGPEVLQLTGSLLLKKSTDWYLQYNGSEFGPFKAPEVERILASGRLTGADIYLWSRELSNWVPVSAIPRFAKLVVDVNALTKTRQVSSQLTIVRGHRREMRGPPRVPLIATVSLGQKGDILGVCEDISPSGMQVCLDSDQRLEGLGELRLWILPLGTTGLEGFWAKARLTWMNGGARRAGFQFAQLDPRAQVALERYLAEAKRRLARDAV